MTWTKQVTLGSKIRFSYLYFQVPEVGRGNPGHSQRSHFWLWNKFSCFTWAKLYHWEHQSFEQSLNISFILFCFSNLILQQHETLCNNTELGVWPLSSISFVYNQVHFWTWITSFSLTLTKCFRLFSLWKPVNLRHNVPKMLKWN